MDEDKKTPVAETPEATPQEVKEGSKTDSDQERIDSIVKTRIERERKKFEEKLKEELQERDRLAQLSVEEQKKELTTKYEMEIAAKAKDVAIRENRLEAIDLLSKAKIPIELVQYVVDEDREKTLEKAEAFIKNYQESVNHTVAEQLKGTPPKDISVNSNKQPKKVVTAF